MCLKDVPNGAHATAEVGIRSAKHHPSAIAAFSVLQLSAHRPCLGVAQAAEGQVH